MKTPILPFLFIILNIRLSISSVLDKHVVECESYDEKKCIKDGLCEFTVEKCTNDSEKPGSTASCYVVWSVDDQGNTKNVTMKGCFTDNTECNQTECISRAEPRNNIHYCCCKGSMCNSEHKYVPTTTEATTQVPKKPTSDGDTVYLAIACVVLGVLIVLFTVGLILYRKRKQAMFNEIPTIEPEVTSSTPCLAIRPIQLIEMKARGRFGAVWQGRLKNDDVAVKIFPMHEKESWQTEYEIYKLPKMGHPNILEFVGAEKHLDKMLQEYWLITAYHNYGSLCDYLKAHTITWLELCKIAESMACGLMHLHEEILPANKMDCLKPAIAHRDFKSKNVLLKNDLTACIADFGLAMIFQPGKSCGDTHGQVGTRRYMAPEVLEGAINFTRDAFLRIDVYACGLVLWEMVSRCDTAVVSSEYSLPFETELGLHPTLDQMQENVVMKKLRPRIPEHWRSHPGLSSICDTMEECWDHDAEARLSSSCVMERISQHTKYPTTQLLIETNTDNNLTFKDSSNIL